MKQPHEMRPGNRYARQAEARRTLGDLIASTSEASAAVVSSSTCDPSRREFPVVDLPRRLRCAECRRHGTAKVYESSR